MKAENKWLQKTEMIWTKRRGNCLDFRGRCRLYSLVSESRTKERLKMKKKCLFLLVLLSVLCVPGCGKFVETEQKAEKETEDEMTMKISVKSAEHEIIYKLNNSQAARELYEQLPLTLEVEDFSTNEKTFYPPKELDISDAPLADADRGTLAYYSPWADVVMFYDYFGKGSSLYELGEAVSGEEDIEKLSGEIEITEAE